LRRPVASSSLPWKSSLNLGLPVLGVSAMRIGAVYLLLAVISVPPPGHRFLRYPLSYIFDGVFIGLLFLFAVAQGTSRPRALWKHCLGGVGIAYVAGLCAELAMTLAQDHGFARFSVVFQDRMIASQWLLLPIGVFAWLDGLLLGWFTWASQQERHRRRLLLLSSVLLGCLVRLLLVLLSIRPPWVSPE
jgi:hypothetical protein